MSGIRRVYVVTDRNGVVIADYATQAPAASAGIAELLAEPPAQIQKLVKEAVAAARPNAEPAAFWAVRTNAECERFLFRSGIVYDEGHLLGGRTLPYYVAIGAPLAQYSKTLHQFTWLYFALIPGSLVLGSILGWVMSGRALSPVRAVAQTAQRLSSSNLQLRIPALDAGDELDYLILTFNRMIERLETSFGQMKQFSSDVSHELRTPITAIRGQIEVALLTAQTPEQYREAMINALQDVDRLSQLVRAMLLLSQAESGQLALQKTNLDLCEQVGELVEQYRIPAEAAGVRLRAELAGECAVHADRVQIGRMITNLLSNALKFTPAGGSITASVRRAVGGDGGGPGGSRVEFAVEDTGTGIAPEHLPHVFSRFYRVPAPGSAPGQESGLGLGLSFVAWIVQAHHGRVSVASTVGKGSRFVVTLPCAGVPSDSISARIPSITMKEL